MCFSSVAHNCGCCDILSSNRTLLPFLQHPSINKKLPSYRPRKPTRNKRVSSLATARRGVSSFLSITTLLIIGDIGIRANQNCLIFGDLEYFNAYNMKKFLGLEFSHYDKKGKAVLKPIKKPFIFRGG
jgi:hypothetical protein